MKSKPQSVAVATGLLLALVSGLGWLWPQSLWGAHAFAFMPPAVASLLLASGLAFIALPAVRGGFNGRLLELFARGTLGRGASVLLVAGAAAAFYALEIPSNYYGNARSFLPLLEESFPALPADLWSRLFSLSPEPGNGRDGVRQLAILIAHVTGRDGRFAFNFLGAVCGAGFVATWLWAVRTTLRSALWRNVFFLIGAGLPLLLVFCGHLETYGVVFLLTLLWAVLALKVGQSGRQSHLAALLAVTVLALRFHSLTYLLLPGLALLILAQLSRSGPRPRLGGELEATATWVLLPLFALGLVAYFFVFGDHDDPRQLTDFTELDRLFLPVVAPAPPLDRYHLFAPAHLLDLLNALLMWSPPLLLIAAWLGIGHRQELRRDRLGVNVLAVCLALFAAMFFMINPLYSLPMDWDLFCYPAILLLVLCLAAAADLEARGVRQLPVAALLGLTLLTAPTFHLYTSESAGPRRLLAVGQHMFRSYYEHASTVLLFSLLEQTRGDPGLYLERKGALIDALRPYAVPGNDKQLADLLLDDAITFLKARRDLERARERLDETSAFFPAAPKLAKTRIQLMQAFFLSGRYGDAHREAEHLIAMGAPSLPRALRMGVHTALMAERYDAAAAHAGRYLELTPNDPLLQEVSRRLRIGDRVSELRSLFAAGP